MISDKSRARGGVGGLGNGLLRPVLGPRSPCSRWLSPRSEASKPGLGGREWAHLGMTGRLCDGGGEGYEWEHLQRRNESLEVSTGVAKEGG